jgi:hypothetical protein
MIDLKYALFIGLEVPQKYPRSTPEVNSIHYTMPSAIVTGATGK